MSTTEHDRVAAEASAVRQWYQDRINIYGVTFESLSAGPVEREQRRHAVHASAISGTEPTVLDIGCGIARFYNFLLKAGRQCRFTGYELVTDYAAQARALYPEIEVIERNILEDPIEGEFDSIVSSQVFNHRYSQIDNLEVMHMVLLNSFNHCRFSVSIDMLSTYVDYEEAHLFYYSPEKVLALAKTISHRVLLRHDYAPYEFCIQLFKDNAPVSGVYFPQSI